MQNLYSAPFEHGTDPLISSELKIKPSNYCALSYVETEIWSLICGESAPELSPSAAPVPILLSSVEQANHLCQVHSSVYSTNKVKLGYFHQKIV